MKTYAALLSLCLVHGAAAFAPQGLFAVKSSELKMSSSPSYLGGLTDTSTKFSPSSVSGSVNALETQKAMEARLAALEKGGQARDNKARKIIEKLPPTTVQGGSLKTWSFVSPFVERVQVVLKTEGRPLDADVELWQGPDNTPHRMRVYVEDGAMRPFSAVIETPRGPNTVCIRNIGQLEFPLSAYVAPEASDARPVGPLADKSDMKAPMIIQGGALRTYPFDPAVESVRIMLRTDGRPLNARIELLQGPNNNKQVIELYTEDGMDRPFFAIIETPGSGNVVRIVNTATVEFPLTAWVEAYDVRKGGSYADPVIGGDGAFMAGSRRGQW